MCQWIIPENGILVLPLQLSEQLYQSGNLAIKDDEDDDDDDDDDGDGDDTTPLSDVKCYGKRAIWQGEFAEKPIASGRGYPITALRSYDFQRWIYYSICCNDTKSTLGSVNWITCANREQDVYVNITASFEVRQSMGNGIQGNIRIVFSN